MRSSRSQWGTWVSESECGVHWLRLCWRGLLLRHDRGGVEHHIVGGHPVPVWCRRGGVFLEPAAHIERLAAGARARIAPALIWACPRPGGRGTTPGACVPHPV